MGGVRASEMGLSFWISHVLDLTVGEQELFIDNEFDPGTNAMFHVALFP